MSNPLIAKYNTAGTYTIKVESGLYRLTLVGGGGNAYYATTGDADGGYAYTRGWGGGSGGAFSGVISLPKGTYTVVIGGVAGSSYITDSTGETVLTVGGGGNAGSWAVGTAGTAPTVSLNYNVLEATVNKAGNAGLTAKGDWGGGYGTGGASVYNGYGTGASINSGGSWGRTDGGFELLTYTESRHNKFYAQEKRVFDINKVTVVGSPTITSDGVASGFSSANYIDIPADIFPEQINSIVIEGEVTTKNLSTNQAMFGCKQNDSTATTPPAVLDVRLSLTGGQIVYSSGIGTQVAPTFSKTMKNNTSYKYKVEIIGTSIKFYLDGEAVFVANNFVYVKPSNFHIGVNRMLGDIFLGSINLPSIKIYVDGELVYTPTKPTYLLERRKPMVWDKEQFTVVGSPVISDSGWASGFSGGNYLTIPFNNCGLVEVNAVFSYGEATSDYSIPFLFFTDNETLTKLNPVIVKSSSLLTVDFGICGIILEKNRDYNIKFITDCQTFVKMLVDDKQVSTRTLTLDEKVNLIGFNIGRGHNSSFPFAGSINLKQFKIYTDNNLVFDGGAETYVYDPNKFTVVGTPTITEQGVASGFTNNDYFSKNITLDSTKTFDIVFKFKTPETITTPNQVIGNSTTYPVINYRLSATRTVFCEFSISSATRHYAISSIALKENTDYYGKISYDKSAVKFYYSENGIDFNILTTLNNITDFNGIYDFANGIGRALGNAAYAYPFQGSIDLKQFSITVDGKEVFTGAKEQFYMLRR